MRSLAGWQLVVASVALVSILDGCGSGGGGSGGGGGASATGGVGGAAGKNGSTGTGGAAGTLGGTGGSGGAGGCVTGNEGCVCYGNATCNGTLRCYSNLCVLVPVDGGAGQTGTAGAGGTAGRGGAAGAAAGASGAAGMAGAGGTAGAAGTAGAGGTSGLAGTTGTGGAAGAAGGATGAGGAAGSGAAGAGGAPATCSAGTADCDLSATNGCETNIATDPMNCGGCALSCPLRAHATAGCSFQTCSFACTGAYKDCNQMASDGCETDSAIDPLNCGGCGTICQTGPHATPGCANKICTVTCDPNYKDCNANSEDGCEVNIGSDSQNCGGCGTTCSPASHATVGCANQTCSLSCDPNYKDCNSLAADGCEVDIATDTANCGGCGNVCPTLYVCIGGHCLVTP